MVRSGHRPSRFAIATDYDRLLSAIIRSCLDIAVAKRYPLPIGFPQRIGSVSTEAWVAVAAVAKLLSVAKDSVYRWIEHQRLPAHRVGRLWKFKLSEIDEWVRAGGAANDEPAVTREPAVAHPRREQLEDTLGSAFEAEPVEDGIEHLAERIIEAALRSDENGQVIGGIESICLDTVRPSFAASTLRCLGRLRNPGSATWRSELVRDALAQGNAELRDAAVQAAESWGEPDLVHVLISHHEPEPWLRDYIQAVIDESGLTGVPGS